MKQIIRVNEHGAITAQLLVEDASLYPDCLEVSDVPFGATHYLDGEFHTKPAQPSPAHQWDDASFTWIPNLEWAKTLAKARINADRNAAELAGFEAYGVMFDSDQDSQRRILVAASTAQTVGATFSIDWTTADNSTILLNQEQMVNLPVIMAQAGNLLHQKARLLKSQIDNAVTIEEINSIQWN